MSSKDKSGQNYMQAWNTYWFGEGKRRRVKGSVLHGGQINFLVLKKGGDRSSGAKIAGAMM